MSISKLLKEVNDRSEQAKNLQLEKLKERLNLAEKAKLDHANMWGNEHDEEWADPKIMEKRKELLFVLQLIEYMDRVDLGSLSKILGGAKLLDELKLKWSLRVRAAHLMGYLNKCADVTQKKIDLNRFLRGDKPLWE